MPFIAEI